MDPIIDSAVRTARKKRALASGVAGADFLMSRVADDLVDRLATVQRSFSAPVAAFGGTAHAALAMARSGRLAAPVRRLEVAGIHVGGADQVVADLETAELAPASADLIVSLLALHAVNDLPGLLSRFCRALRPDGLFIAALPGAGTLAELRDSLLAADAENGGASPRVLPFVDLRDGGALLQKAGFALPVADVEPIVVRYPDLAGLMKDLRAMGETNCLVARSRRSPGRRLFARAERHCADHHADPDGRIRTTFSVLWLMGWAPDAAQPRPLAPGSAQMRLAEALRAR